MSVFNSFSGTDTHTHTTDRSIRAFDDQIGAETLKKADVLNINYQFNAKTILFHSVNGKLDKCYSNVNYSDSGNLCDEMPVSPLHFLFFFLVSFMLLFCASKSIALYL